jgi:hypothetical protein
MIKHEMDGRTQNLAPDELAATMPPLRGESASPGLVIRSILAVAAARGRSRRVAPLLTPACTDPRRSCAHERDATLNRRRAAFRYRPIRRFSDIDHMDKKSFNCRGKLRSSLMIDGRAPSIIRWPVPTGMASLQENPPETVCSVARVLRQ